MSLTDSVPFQCRDNIATNISMIKMRARSKTCQAMRKTGRVALRVFFFDLEANRGPGGGHRKNPQHHAPHQLWTMVNFFFYLKESLDFVGIRCCGMKQFRRYPPSYQSYTSN